jgi:hypothetical protein
MSIIELTNKIVKESNMKISTIAKKSGVNAGTIRYWDRECANDALLSNVNAVLNQCGYCLAVVRKCEDNYVETREQQRIS